MSKNTTAVGNRAETLACEYLLSNRYKIIERNYKDRFCEIDIVAKHKDTIAFVEVKYRASADFGGAIGSVTPTKLKRMQNSAQYWLAKHEDYMDYQPRLDVITIVGDINFPEIAHIENVN
ncbi:MAG: putative endonuclease [Patescibacteria group bacterium]|jgi:putative endonuclease|nr:putative endonuclease [Patescibacteria group bacterium]